MVPSKVETTHPPHPQKTNAVPTFSDENQTEKSNVESNFSTGTF